MPPLTYRATPRAALIVASVAMKGCSFQRATTKPLTAPAERADGENGEDRRPEPDDRPS